MNGVLHRAMMARLASPARRLKRPYPTLQGQNVYVSCPRRIRFTLETYTFYSRYVYVRTREGTRSTDTSDEVREVGAEGAGEELGSDGGKKGSTVGRRCDLP